MMIARSSVVALLAIMTCAAWTRAANVGDFLDFSIRPSRGQVLLAGRLYAPPAAPTNLRPLIVFMHGSGESGNNNTAQVNFNIDNLLSEAKRRGAFLYAPQAPSSWSSLETLSLVTTMIDRAVAEHNVDPRRVYVTGLSMGGGGAWNMLNHYGERFAAGVPICGISPTTGYLPAKLFDEPIWAFHARDDSVVNVATSRNVINGILAANGDPPPTYLELTNYVDFQFSSPSLDLRYTEFYGGEHGIWSRVYNTPAMYDWLFSQASVPEPNSAIISFLAAAAVWSGGRSQRRASHLRRGPTHLIPHRLT
jgi:predicted peptidase